MNKNNSITFKVSDKINKNKINYNSISIDDILKNVSKDDDNCIVEDKLNNNNHNKKIISTSINNDIKYIGYNSFVMSAIEAYSNHLELVIRPDDIWAAIINQFSIYVEKNSTKLKDKFIINDSGNDNISGCVSGNENKSNEKKKLVVYTSYPIFKAPIDKLTIDMANEIEKNIKDPSIRNWVVPSFTTTTDIDKVVFSASLMSVTKSYFTFEYQTLCGLPQVTLLGTIDDWVDLKKRVQRLKEFSLNNDSGQSSILSFFKKFNNNNNNSCQMNKWVELLNPVLDKFIESSSGKPDIEWWNKIAHKKSGSGSKTINGWITVFCVYDCESNWLGDNFQTAYFDEVVDKKNSWLDIPFSSIPRGYLEVPVLLKDSDGTIYNSTLYSGHMGVTFNNNSIIKPSLDWCLVVDK